MENKEIVQKEYDLSHLIVEAAPHQRSAVSIQRIMLDVIIALIPALIVSVYEFGMRSLVLVLSAVIACVLSEYCYQKIMKQPSTISDLSAVVTGMLLAYNVPVTLPIPMIVIGSVFSIIIVKQLFGGIGSNFMNPALAGRAFLMASWAQAMSNYTAPLTQKAVDAESYATVLSGGQPFGFMNAIIGHMGGTIGEVSAIALLIGVAYLLYRRVINLRIPLVYIATTFVTLLICGVGIQDACMNIFIGGLILGAFYMATDYSTSPVTPKGQIIFAIGCGFFTAIIRQFGNLPEGVSYAIIFMNCAVPFIDQYTVPTPIGRGGKQGI